MSTRNESSTKNVNFDESEKRGSLKNLDHELEELEMSISGNEEELQNLIVDKKYLKAEKVKEDLDSLKKLYKAKKRQMVELEHKKANHIFEEAQSSEFEDFNAYWDNKYENFNAEVTALENELISRHKDDLLEFMSRIEDILPQRVKETSEILNLRKIEESLVKVQRFKEAQQVVDKRKDKEIDAIEKFKQGKDELAEKHLQQFTKKQNLELDALRVKIQAKRNELDTQRVSELESLLHKYKNVRKEMDITQGLERSKLGVLERKVSVKHYDTFDSKRNSMYYGKVSTRKSNFNLGKTINSGYGRKSRNSPSRDNSGY